MLNQKNFQYQSLHTLNNLIFILPNITHKWTMQTSHTDMVTQDYKLKIW